MAFGPTHLTPYADRDLVGPRYHSYHPDSEPDSFYRQHPLRILCPSLGVLRLKDPRAKCERNLDWNIDWAVAFIVDHLKGGESSDAANSLKAIRIRAAELEKDGHGREIPYRMFNKLDQILFAGHLKNAVYLDMANLGPDVSGSTHSHGWGLNPDVKRISIVLNGDVLQCANSRDTVALLIHHMIHAYFLVACGPQQEKEVGYGRLAHGLHFGKIMMTIRKLSAAHNKPLQALDFGHPLNKPRYWYDDYDHRRHRFPRRLSKERWYCSHCSSEVDGIADGDIDDWYNGVCKPLLDLSESLRSSTVQIYNDQQHTLEQVSRAEAPPSTKSNEFIFGDCSVLVPSDKIENFQSICHAFEKAASRYIEMSEDIDADTFARFLELLHTGSYGPDAEHLHHQHIHTHNHSSSRKGSPPVIKSATTPEEPPYLLTDIKMFKLGVAMQFEEPQRAALARLYAHGTTHEDAVSLLAAIYDGGAEPHPELKSWARRFLVRVPSPAEPVSASTTHFAGLGGGIVQEPSNLAKLECDMFGYKARFAALLQKSSALKYEVGRARRELWERGLYVAPGVFGGVGLGLVRGVSPPLGALGVPMQMGMGVCMPVGVGAGTLRPTTAINVLGLPWGAAPPPHSLAEDGGIDAYFAREFGFTDEEEEEEEEEEGDWP